MMELILGIAAPLMTAVIAYSIIRQFSVAKLLILVIFGGITSALLVNANGPEGPIYRLFVCIVVIILFLVELLLLNSKPITKNDRKKLLYLLVLLMLILVLSFSDGLLG